jgi:hypothetical protein
MLLYQTGPWKMSQKKLLLGMNMVVRYHMTTTRRGRTTTTTRESRKRPSCRI